MKLTSNSGCCDALHEVDPALVGLELAVAGHLVELAPRRVERRNPGVAAARQVDGGEVERQAEQVVAQRLGLELVDLVADLAGGAAHDGAGRLFGGAACRRWLNASGLRKASIRPISLEAKFGIEPVDLVEQHRVAEAVDHVRELGDDRRIELRREALGRQEHVDVRLDLARELLEHQVLVLHLGAELGGLEQALAVPLQGSISCRGGTGNVVS